MDTVNRRLLGSLLVALLAAAPLGAQTTPAATAAALRAGGYVIVMRHANSPREAPDAATANADNTTRERQLDADGRRAASAMGAASQERSAWLRAQVARTPQAGGNRLLIPHGPNISAAFPEHASGMGEGDALVFDPRGKDGPVMVQRIRIGDWAGL